MCITTFDKNFKLLFLRNGLDALEGQRGRHWADIRVHA